jgi:hypothetical protein
MDNQLTPTSIVALFDMSKADHANFATMIVDAMDNGNADPLKVHLQLKSMEKVFKNLTDKEENEALSKRYRDHVLSAAQQYGGKKFEFHNSVIEIKEAGTKYDYSQCCDPILADLEKRTKELSDELKSRQKMLQLLKPSGQEMIDPSTGESFTAYPPAKTSTTSVQVTIK